MRGLQSKAIAVIGVAALIVAACGSSPTAPTDPVGGVAFAFETAKSGGVLKQMDLVTCLTTGGSFGNALTGLLGGIGAAAQAQAGVSSDDLSAAWKISFDDLKTTETSRSGDTATVHVSVKVTSELDAGKFRELIKKYAATQGVVPDDATIDAAIQAKLGGQLKMSETIDKDISVVQQDGKWVACGSSLGTAAGLTPAPTVGAPDSSSGGITFTPSTFSCAPESSAFVASSATLPSSVTNRDRPGLTWQLDGATIDFGSGPLSKPDFLPQSDGSWLFTDRTFVAYLCLDQIGTGIGQGPNSIGPHTIKVLDSSGKILAEGSFTVTGDSAQAQASAVASAPTSVTTTPSPDLTPTPSPTPSPLIATAITTGSQHACAIVAGGGGVMCWGSNRSGQLGDGTTTDSVVPVQVAGITDAAAVVADKSADFGRTCVIRVAGSVACWGNGRSGELGDTTPDSLTPVPVPGITDGVALAVGGAHACVLRSGGGVVCWGGNRSGELGDGTTTTSLAPIPVPGLADATAIAAGDSHTCALRAGGEVACWGYNLASGTEVTGSTPENVPGITDAIGVAAGAAHTCALLSGGGIMCWGNNERGQLGGVASVDGQVKPYSKAPLAVAGITDATAIVAGQYYTCAIRSDRRATCWGDNLYGQLGDGTNTASPTPVTVTALTDTKALAAGERITCALGSTGAVTCWGAGPLGNGSMSSSTTPVPVWGP